MCAYRLSNLPTWLRQPRNGMRSILFRTVYPLRTKGGIGSIWFCRGRLYLVYRQASPCTIAPPPCQRRFQIRFRACFPPFVFGRRWSNLFMWILFINKSLSRIILFFYLAACNGKYSSFSPSCNRRLRGGYRRNTNRQRYLGGSPRR